ncbi:MAG: hypothetical protein ACK5TR_04505 [Alphaproteobacteria bacterium]|jgi:hypothetical protein|nr:coiled-coil domain-containing family 149 protein [Alphaproteobacteria bacterium]
MMHRRARLFSCVVFIAVSTTFCHASSPEFDLEQSARPVSYISSVTSSVSDALHFAMDNFFAAISKSCRSVATRLRLADNSSHQSPFMGFAHYKARNPYWHALPSSLLTELRQDKWASSHFIWLPHPLEKETFLRDFTPPQSTQTDSDQTVEMLKDAIEEQQKNRRVIGADTDPHWVNPQKLSPEEKFELCQQELKEAVSKISALEKSHEKEISVLKRAYLKKETAYLQKISLLEEQLYAVLRAQFSMPDDFDPNVYLALHEHLKKYTDEKNMTAEEAHEFAVTHYKNYGGPLEHLPYKVGMETSIILPHSTSADQPALGIPDGFPEDLISVLLETPELIIQAHQYRLNLEEYTRRYLALTSAGRA